MSMGFIIFKILDLTVLRESTWEQILLQLLKHLRQWLNVGNYAWAILEFLQIFGNWLKKHDGNSNYSFKLCNVDEKFNMKTNMVTSLTKKLSWQKSKFLIFGLLIVSVKRDSCLKMHLFCRIFIYILVYILAYILRMVIMLHRTFSYCVFLDIFEWANLSDGVQYSGFIIIKS